jgi:hypothetical protein
LSTYFEERQVRCGDNIHTAMMVEAAVAQDVRKMAQYGDLTADVGIVMLDALKMALRQNNEARILYKHTGRSRMLERLETAFRSRPQPDQVLGKAQIEPTKLAGIDLQTGEFQVPLANGYSIVSGWIDHDDPDALPAGDYLSVFNAAGKQVFYRDTADLLADPINAKALICEFLFCCAGVIRQDEEDTSSDG